MLQGSFNPKASVNISELFNGREAKFKLFYRIYPLDSKKIRSKYLPKFGLETVEGLLPLLLFGILGQLDGSPSLLQLNCSYLLGINNFGFNPCALVKVVAHKPSQFFNKLLFVNRL